MSGKEISPWHVGVAAEAYAAALFARYGYDVSVQYGANPIIPVPRSGLSGAH